MPDFYICPKCYEITPSDKDLDGKTCPKNCSGRLAKIIRPDFKLEKLTERGDLKRHIQLYDSTLAKVVYKSDIVPDTVGKSILPFAAGAIGYLTLKKLLPSDNSTKQALIGGIVLSAITYFLSSSSVDRKLERRRNLVRYNTLFNKINVSSPIKVKAAWFSDLFCPNRNDVVYGCWESRIIYTNIYLMARDKEFKQRAINLQRFVKTDTFNDATWREKSLLRNLFKDESQFLTLAQKRCMNYKEVLTENDQKLAKNYLESMCKHKKYSFRKLVKDLLNATNPDKKYASIRRKFALELRDLGVLSLDKLIGKFEETYKSTKITESSDIANVDGLIDMAYDKQTRRACKFGIEYSLGKARHVHFILDGQEWDDSYHNSDRTTRIPITVSELKFVYKKWEMEEQTRNLIHFYRNGVKVAPPWLNKKSCLYCGFVGYRTHLRNKVKEKIVIH